MSYGAVARIKVELVEANHSTKFSKTRNLNFPEKGFSARGIVVTRLLDWLLNSKICAPGKLIAHGFNFDLKKYNTEQEVEVVELQNGVYLRRKDFVASEKKQEVKSK